MTHNYCENLRLGAATSLLLSLATVRRAVVIVDEKHYFLNLNINTKHIKSLPVDGRVSAAQMFLALIVLSLRLQTRSKSLASSEMSVSIQQDRTTLQGIRFRIFRTIVALLII